MKPWDIYTLEASRRQLLECIEELQRMKVLVVFSQKELIEALGIPQGEADMVKD